LKGGGVDDGHVEAGTRRFREGSQRQRAVALPAPLAEIGASLPGGSKHGGERRRKRELNGVEPLSSIHQPKFLVDRDRLRRSQGIAGAHQGKSARARTSRKKSRIEVSPIG